MSSHPTELIREIVACLMCSELYFSLCPSERLALVKETAERHREVALRFIPAY